MRNVPYSLLPDYFSGHILGVQNVFLSNSRLERKTKKHPRDQKEKKKPISVETTWERRAVPSTARLELFEQQRLQRTRQNKSLLRKHHHHHHRQHVCRRRRPEDKSRHLHLKKNKQKKQLPPSDWGVEVSCSLCTVAPGSSDSTRRLLFLLLLSILAIKMYSSYLLPPAGVFRSLRLMFGEQQRAPSRCGATTCLQLLLVLLE